jgi:cytoskeletal protein RodZ
VTARHQLRLGKRLGRDRSPIDAAPAPPVGETLQLARERKGVDLYRAERDTKIRLRYLQALEDSDWEELPAPVYTKGFLRNYAIYLGLEPDEILDRWRDEMESLRTATRVAVAPPPMPLVEPGGRRVTLSPGKVWAVVVGVVVLAFLGYLGIQFLRYVDVTEVALVYPSNVYSTINADHVELQGTAGRGATIAITGPDGQSYPAQADSDGHWRREVALSRGQNNFTIVATDPVTQRSSTPLPIVITVPLPSNSPGATSSAAPPPPIAMTLFGPTAGFTTSDANVTVSGTTTGTRITIVSTYLGGPAGTPVPSAAPLATAPPSESPLPSGQPSPTPGGPPAGPSADITISSGSFTQSLVFPVGQWRVTVTSYATGLVPVAQDVEIVVEPPPVVVHHLSILVAGRTTTLKVDADGVVVPGLEGVEVSEGQTFQVTASSEFCIRTQNAGVISLTLDATAVGLLGTKGESGSWTLRPGQTPQPASTPC